MSEPQGTVWALSTGLEYEGGHVLAVFPGPEAASAYLESRGVRILGHYEARAGKAGLYLTPGWRKGEVAWFAEIGTDGGYGDYAMIKRVPWNPAVPGKEETRG